MVQEVYKEYSKHAYIHTDNTKCRYLNIRQKRSQNTETTLKAIQLATRSHPYTASSVTDQLMNRGARFCPEYPSYVELGTQKIHDTRFYSTMPSQYTSLTEHTTHIGLTIAAHAASYVLET
jgi:hypothetical protein